jgi:hypothetical protein
MRLKKQDDLFFHYFLNNKQSKDLSPRKGNRDLFIWQQRPIYMAKQAPLSAAERASKNKMIYFFLNIKQSKDLSPRKGNRDLFKLLLIYVAKEAYLDGYYLHGKRGLSMAKEAYLYGKRGLFIWQKRRHSRPLKGPLSPTESPSSPSLRLTLTTSRKRRRAATTLQECHAAVLQPRGSADVSVAPPRQPQHPTMQAPRLSLHAPSRP